MIQGMDESIVSVAPVGADVKSYNIHVSSGREAVMKAGLTDNRYQVNTSNSQRGNWKLHVFRTMSK